MPVAAGWLIFEHSDDDDGHRHRNQFHFPIPIKSEPLHLDVIPKNRATYAHCSCDNKIVILFPVMIDDRESSFYSQEFGNVIDQSTPRMIPIHPLVRPC